MKQDRKQQQSSSQNQPSQPQQQEEQDPNREPGDEELYNRDKQGNIFYDKNTEIRREEQFHDATAVPLHQDEKVTKDNDQFGKQKNQK